MCINGRVLSVLVVVCCVWWWWDVMCEGCGLLCVVAVEYYV